MARLLTLGLLLPRPRIHCVLACGRPAAMIIQSQGGADVLDVFCRDVGKTIIFALSMTSISFNLICQGILLFRMACFRPTSMRAHCNGPHAPAWSVPSKRGTGLEACSRLPRDLAGLVGCIADENDPRSALCRHPHGGDCGTRPLAMYLPSSLFLCRMRARNGARFARHWVQSVQIDEVG
jgi:hypothetical protein